MDIRKSDTAVVFIDPQNGVLSEKGANWKAVGANVTQNRTVQNMERIFKAAKTNGYEVVISPHLHGRNLRGEGNPRTGAPCGELFAQHQTAQRSK